MKSPRIVIFSLICTLLFLVACNPARKVERRGGYLLVKNNIKSDNSYLPTDEIEGFIQQSAMGGRLTPFFRPGVWFYESSTKGKPNWFKNFVKKALGKEPVILDTNLTYRSVDNLRLYMKNKGFYHARVSKKISYGKKIAKVTYQISAGPPCLVTNLRFNISDTLMKKIILEDSTSDRIHTGMIYDTYVLDDERESIAGNMRNNGYYNFSLSDIYYFVDTMDNGMQAHLEVNVKKLKLQVSEGLDSIIEITHPRYYIKNIYFTLDFEQGKQILTDFDTLSFHYKRTKNDTIRNVIYVLHKGKVRLKPLVLTSALQFSSGKLYNQQAVNLTYKNLVNLPYIRASAISMVDKTIAPFDTSQKQSLDCNVRLTRNKLNTLSLGTEGTNSAGRLGIGLNSIFQNRNIFRGAEVLSVKVKTSAEIQANLSNTSTDNLFLAFNTLEGGIEASIDFPRILLPNRAHDLRSNRQAHTSLSAGSGFEYRPDYRRTITTSAWSYKWDATEKLKYIFTPLELNFVSISHISSDFQHYLDSLTDPQFKSLYTNHLLAMIRYSLVSSDMVDIKKTKQYLLRINLETSGNTISIFDKLTNRKTAEGGYYEHFGVRYSQFARADLDFRRYWKITQQKMLAFRFAAGIAVPYGNSEIVPFEKSFWLGGANDMRGWKLRSLGPGKYSAEGIKYDQAGDIMLQTSIEQRFPIYSFILGGIFIDAGNIWLLKDTPDFPGGVFRINSFADQIAMDAGFGLRFDFSFFVFRLDWALPFRNPARENKWFNSNDIRIKNASWNFGIGYPF